MAAHNGAMDQYSRLKPDTADVFRRLDATGRPQRELAAALGIEENKISKVKVGERQLKAEELLSARAWLDGVEAADDPEAPQTVEPAAEDAVEIREWDYAYGMGGGTFLDLPVTGDTHQFSRSWLRQFTHAPPTHIFLARGTGDSMSPTILDSDVVIIDTSERTIRTGDKIWAITYGEVGLIKRVRPMPDGNFKLLSDNQVVDAETAYDGEMNVVGRVVAVVRKT